MKVYFDTEMSPRSSSGKKHVKTVKLQGSKPLNPKIVGGTQKSQKINIKSEISKLSSDMKILIELAEEQPKTSKELERATGLSEDTVRTWTKRLADAGMIEKTPEGWDLSNHKSLTSEVKEALTRTRTRAKVNEALEELRAERYANITLQDVSRKTRLPPGVIEIDAYLLAPDHGLAVADEASWRPDMSLDISLDKTSLKRPRKGENR